MLIDGNCRVEDRGLKTHHGHVSLGFTFSITMLILELEVLIDVYVMCSIEFITLFDETCLR